MANHKSTKKRIRQTVTKTLLNRYQHKTTRNAIRDLRNTTDKKEAEKNYPKVVTMIDKLAKRNIIHKNKASNLKSKLKIYINHLDSKSVDTPKLAEKKPATDTKVKKTVAKASSQKPSKSATTKKTTIAKKK